jgi:hypothetical protein
VFASDEEALAAARAHYEQFVATVDTVLLENGVSPERIDEFASPELAEKEKQGISEFAAKGYRMSGRALITNAVLQSRSESSDIANVVTLYVCMDVSDIDIVDSNGNSVVESTRPDQNAFEVTFDARSSGSMQLLVTSESVWNGGGVC